MKGWIRLFSRRFLDWGWYTDTPTKCVFLHCLLKADHKDTFYKGIEVKSGQFVTSVPKLSKELGLSEQSIKTALNKLSKDHTINRQATNRFTLITVENWGKYQSEKKTGNWQVTDNQPAEQPTTNFQVTDHQNKNNKNSNNNNIYNNAREEQLRLGVFNNVKLTVGEFKALQERFTDVDIRIDKLSAYKKSTGKFYDDDYATICSWAMREEKQVKQDKFEAVKGREI